MEGPVFPDKSQPPREDELAAVLGRAKRLWDDFAAHAQTAVPAAVPEWKFYTKKSGWTFLLRGTRRNVLYMRPVGRATFAVSFAFGEKAVSAAEQSHLPKQVVDAIRNSPKYPEGRLARVTVTTAADVKIAKQLLAIKAEN